MKEKIKEAREWTNLVLTFLIFVGIPAGAYIFHTQKLEIEQASDQKYATKAYVQKFQEETNSKLDKLSDQTAQINTAVAVIKTTLDKQQQPFFSDGH